MGLAWQQTEMLSEKQQPAYTKTYVGASKVL